MTFIFTLHIYALVKSKNWIGKGIQKREQVKALKNSPTHTNEDWWRHTWLWELPAGRDLPPKRCITRPPAWDTVFKGHQVQYAVCVVRKSELMRLFSSFVPIYVIVLNLQVKGQIAYHSISESKFTHLVKLLASPMLLSFSFSPLQLLEAIQESKVFLHGFLLYLYMFLLKMVEWYFLNLFFCLHKLFSWYVITESHL